MEPFIKFNTEKRKQATSDFEKNWFKLLNNSNFGKTIESVRNTIDFHLVNDEKKLLKLSSSVRLQEFYKYDSDLCGTLMKSRTILLHKHIYVGFSVLVL